MKVLSLFDGISCGQQALKELNIPVEKYYSSEIDKYAISITQKNFPKTIQLGDIENWREWKSRGLEYWKQIDLIQGGSPCQGFSFAGKQLNFEDPRSKLFFTFVDILNHAKKHNPNVKFLLENVRMKQEYQDIISEALGVKQIMINSALVSAQNRVRLYWTNIAEIEQPEDRGILLKDILESSDTIKEEFYKSREARIYKKKAPTLRAGRSGLLCKQVGEANLKGHDSIKGVYSPEGKAPTVTTMGGGHREPKVAVDRDKSHAITASVGRTTAREYFKKNQGQLVQDKNGRYEHNNLYWRKLTPLECERLQTLPDTYTAKGINEKGEVDISNTQRYKALGNGWTVEVIKHIYKNLQK